ncbi:MAG: transposase [Bacteroidetes bacterium]|nr:transposase [Bacteroidota bacterium]
MVVLRKFDPEKHHRRSIRLKGYDYTTPGAYFVTICASDRGDFFGTTDNCRGGSRTRPYLNDFGKIVEYTWMDLARHNPRISLDVYMIMPDHFHGIIMINRVEPAMMDENATIVVGAGPGPAPTKRIHGLPEIVRQFKTFSARRINELRGSPGKPVWQRNYYEHIIRPGNEIERIRDYIRKNPRRAVPDPPVFDGGGDKDS